MIFGRLNPRIVTSHCWVLKSNFSSLAKKSLIIEQPKYLITTRTNTTNSTDSQNQQNFSYRNVALVIASTAMIGLVKLYDHAIGNNDDKKEVLDLNNFKETYLNGKNLLAKEDKKDNISDNEVST